MVVLMHEAFNPDCCAEIISIGRQLCPYVHKAEVDNIPGVYHQQAYEIAAPPTMWGKVRLCHAQT